MAVRDWYLREEIFLQIEVLVLVSDDVRQDELKCLHVGVMGNGRGEAVRNIGGSACASSTRSFHPTLISAPSLAACSGRLLVVGVTAGVFTEFDFESCRCRQKATRGDEGSRTAFRSACRSRRLTLSWSARRFCRCHCSITTGGGTSTVHSRRAMAASQYCIIMLVMGMWSSGVSEMLQ